MLQKQNQPLQQKNRACLMQAAAAAEEAKPMFAPASEFQPTAADEPAPAYQPEVAEDNRSIRCPQKRQHQSTPSEDAMARLRTAPVNTGVPSHARAGRRRTCRVRASAFRHRISDNRMSGGSELGPKGTASGPFTTRNERTSAPSPRKPSVHRNRRKLKFLHSCVVRQA